MSDALHPAASKSFLLRDVVHYAAQYIPVLDEILRERHLRYRMRTALGYKPNLSQPKTFNEKLGWRILHDRNPLLALTTDKINVRRYVADRVGNDVLVPLLGIWSRAEEIEWDKLPNRFVLKGSHGWNMNLLVHDRTALDTCAAVSQANGWLRCNHYQTAGEWAYRDLVPRLLAEEMLLDADGGIPADLKFYVFHGRARLLRVHTGRHSDHRANSYDERLEPLSLRQSCKPDPNYVLPLEAHDALQLAERIGADFDFARVDLYCVGGQVRFGEITHYDGNACAPFWPASFDRVMGDYWTLPFD
ncbi:ATP-grasp fold amidoligase family protein [Belnapia moabensis]|uniref:ATP-grasp fold amidoligase family protein n=1 Tax=Belnapia moabensis TaxID=365533 RepID=UPI0009FF4882|nr:ATP-grasp fold amidoligase family protein [Belnapia moabensis]